MRLISSGFICRFALATALLTAISGCTLTGRGRVGIPVIVAEAPPPPPPRRRAITTYPGQVWIDGHYIWDGGRYVWRDGYYVRARPGYTYVPGRWRRHGNGHIWVSGQWRASRGRG